MPEVGDLVTVRLVSEVSGQPIINNISFSALVPFGTWTELSDQMFGDLGAALGLGSPGGTWVTNRSSLFVTSQMQIIDVFPGVAPLRAYVLGDVGDGAADIMPPNDCVAITFRSDFKGPSGRGRMYLNGYPESGATNGFWESDVQDAASNVADSLNTNFGELAGAASFRWSVLHRVSGGAPVVPPEVKPVMSWTVHNEIRSLSRRAMGRRIRRTRPAA